MGAASKHVLILGFPSLVSTAVTASMLNAGYSVSLLVLAQDKKYVKPLKKRYGKKLQILHGNGAHLDLGLGGGEYLELARTVDNVLVLYSNDMYAQSASVAFAIAKELVEFCSVATQLKHVFYVGGFGFVADFDGIVAENDLVLPMSYSSLSSHDSYAHGVLRIEQLLRRFHLTFPLSIVRCGTLVGDANVICEVVLYALGFPELFLKSRRASLWITAIASVSDYLLAALRSENCGKTVHLINEKCELHQLYAQVVQMAKAQVPNGYDLRTSARRYLKNANLSASQISRQLLNAKIQNSWTNQYLEAHNFPKCDFSLDWQPLVDGAVEVLTGFR